jgi:hypothetical protein
VLVLVLVLEGVWAVPRMGLMGPMRLMSSVWF